ncbi:MAG: thiosulfate oxidation carrier complex protein SoxZ [Henriciella sp.]|uniref:thiosulfate oxidation carrier complex protein SoxZ n=1 Tax=Henriciella sp. TaxID=1968823 RepID=UPI003C738176
MAIRISAPDTAAKGDVIELKALIQHPMETGYRRNNRGETIERDIITDFKCVYDGETVFEASLQPGIAANPFLSFFTKATVSGDLTFTWTDQDGETWSQTHTLTVE